MRRRYLTLKIISEQQINENSLLNIIWAAIYQLFGEYGASQVNLSLIHHYPHINYAVIRCSHVSLNMVRAAIASITNINDKPIVIHVVRVSGTLRSIHQMLDKLLEL